MTSRHPSRSTASADADWPIVWLFTDERMPSCPIVAARALPPRSGIVFRHYATAKGERQRLFRSLLRVARARRQVLLLADGRHPLHLGSDGVHGSVRRGFHPGRRALSIGVHNQREAAIAQRMGVKLAFISPVFATQSHAGARTLGVAGFARLAARCPGRCIALGGMNAARFGTLRRHGAHGWGAIDALSQAPGHER